MPLALPVNSRYRPYMQSSQYDKTVSAQQQVFSMQADTLDVLVDGVMRGDRALLARHHACGEPEGGTSQTCR